MINALILEAQLAARQASPDAGRLLAKLDSTLLTAPDGPSLPGNLLRPACTSSGVNCLLPLAAVRRRIFGLDPWPENVTYVREEGRLAALTGDLSRRRPCVSALSGYPHRSRKPALRAQVAQVRADLAALEQGAQGGHPRLRRYRTERPIRPGSMDRAP